MKDSIYTIKQEIIKSAWEHIWPLVKDYLFEDGWTTDLYNPNSVDIKYMNEFFERELMEGGGNQSQFNYYKFRPKSLKGIENNNGWIPISTRPPSTGDYFVEYHDNQVKILKYDARIDDFSNGHRSGYLKRVKHWQPIKLPKNSLYNG